MLGEKARVARTSVADATPKQITTPESYLGYARLDRFANGAAAFDAESDYRFPERLAQDRLAYAGRWTVEPSRIVAGANARLRLRFQASNIYLVLAGSGQVRSFVDGRQPRTIAVSGRRGSTRSPAFHAEKRGLLELRLSPDVEGYAFTFG